MMKEKNVNRREFLQTALTGVTLAAAGGIFSASGQTVAAAKKKSIFVCSVCGHVEFGTAPDFCPVCHVSKDKFMQNDSLFTDAEAKDAHLAEGHVPVITTKKQSVLIPEQSCAEAQVRVGKKIHPMVEEHHIRFIDCYLDDRHITRIMLTNGVYAAAKFEIKSAGLKVRVVELCNLHGYWQAEAALG